MEKVDLYTGVSFYVMVNPTPLQFATYFTTPPRNKSDIRGISKTGPKKTFYFWEAKYAVHEDIGNHFGIVNELGGGYDSFYGIAQKESSSPTARTVYRYDLTDYVFKPYMTALDTATQSQPLVAIHTS